MTTNSFTKTALSRRQFLASTAVASIGLTGLGAGTPSSVPVFAQRGYYVLPCRAPTLGYEACRDMIDCMADDRANTVILWIGGGFRSKKFPITWQYNADHANVRHDFLGRLIRHAHRRDVKCLLGFTPFGYDGVNQYPREHPELKAIGPDGKPVAEFGIHCWGWNLCPAKAESQRFMIQYARELAFEFYPEADGLFLESSDYAICHCPQCGPRHFDHEFKFVQDISEEVWTRKADATIVVYPHYFSGAKLRFAFSEAVATKHAFDPRWTLFFTPHSAAIEPGLIARAKGSWWWNEAPSRFDIPNIRAGAQRARDAHCTGFIPSLECYSYVQTHEEFGEPWLNGRRQTPFGFGWLAKGDSPYRELPMRRAGCLSRVLGEPGSAGRCVPSGVGWRPFRAGLAARASPGYTGAVPRLWHGPRLDRARTADNARPRGSRRKSGRLDAKKRAFLRDQLARVRVIAGRHRDATTPGARELARIAQWLCDQWQGANNALLES